MSLRQAEEVARNFDKSLTAYSFGPSSFVLLIHHDGTVLLFQSAFMATWRDYILVFTEHHRTHVYHREDLDRWHRFEAVRYTPRLDDNSQVIKELTCPKCARVFPIDQVRKIQEVEGHDPELQAKVLEQVSCGKIDVDTAAKMLNKWWTEPCDPDKWVEVCLDCYNKWDNEMEALIGTPITGNTV